MKALLTAALCLCALAAFSDCVTVQVGEFSFSLESVKKLKDLLGNPGSRNPALRSAISVPVCANPALPKEFLQLCAAPNADQMFATLRPIARSPDICEICAFAACAGC
ncbi:guanylin [Emydura macquarii macquarii]|uniref:guanylin n=1 Tax=Emydura macquarii macquarii TaxID=1129001 RepID=UPI00352B7E9E